MRLINVHTRILQDFPSEAPPYCAASHTWEEEEIQHIEFRDFESARQKKPQSAKKIEVFLDNAAKEGYEWLWIDTLCIDKSSSDELAEAINSMFKWYQNAAKSFVYLSDVHSTSGDICADAFRQSRWFQRGWTLQELLAPSHVQFIDGGGRILGSLQDENVLDLVEETTGIPADILTGKKGLSSASTAQRMSWAAHRQTKRPEDLAYSLQGIFGVNMAPVYGEGKERAFLRLQEEIVKTSNDQSIFAWQMLPGLPKPQHSLFAPSPKYFAKAGNVVCGVPFASQERLNDSYFELTKRGLRAELPVMKIQDGNRDPGDPNLVALLNCSYLRKDGRLKGPIALPLKEGRAIDQHAGIKRPREFWVNRIPCWSETSARLRTVHPKYYDQCGMKNICIVREQPIARTVRCCSSSSARIFTGLSPTVLELLIKKYTISSYQSTENAKGVRQQRSRSPPWMSTGRSMGTASSDLYHLLSSFGPKKPPDGRYWRRWQSTSRIGHVHQGLDSRCRSRGP